MTVDTSCTFTSIQCGQSYTYTVVAYSTFGCQTEASSPQTTDAGEWEEMIHVFLPLPFYHMVRHIVCSIKT